MAKRRACSTTVTLLLSAMPSHDNATAAPGIALSEAALLADAARRSIAYRGAVPTQRVFPSADAIAALVAFDGDLPPRGLPDAEILDRLDRVGSPATVAIAGGRYFGFVNGGSLPVAVAAHWLATAWDQNCALQVMSPTAAACEATAIAWLSDVLGLPPSAGALVAGASMANLTALAAARHAVYARVGWDVDNDGLNGAPPVTVVVGAEVHATLRRALGHLGLGRTQTMTLPVDGQGRIVARDLPRLAGPAIVCIQAGNVNTGAFDPAEALCAWAHAHDAWVHVDGAFGLWARACPARAAQANGFDLADSWATDAHKWLNVPYDCGIGLVRDEQALRAAMSLTAAYLPPSGVRDPMHYSPDGSRRARGVDVWAALASLGRDGVAALVDRCCDHASRMSEGLRGAGFEVLNEVTLNQVLVSFGDADATRRVIAAVQADGTCWCGGTTWQGREAMRISVSSHATTTADIDASLAAIVRCAAAVRGGAS